MVIFFSVTEEYMYVVYDEERSTMQTQSIDIQQTTEKKSVRIEDKENMKKKRISKTRCMISEHV